MKPALILFLAASSARGQDAGTDLPEAFVVRTAGTLEIGPAPLVPPVYIYPEPAHKAVDDELKRCQYNDAHPKVEPDVKGYLIGMSVVGTLMFLAGAAVGAAVISSQKPFP